MIHSVSIHSVSIVTLLLISFSSLPHWLPRIGEYGVRCKHPRARCGFWRVGYSAGRPKGRRGNIINIALADPAESQLAGGHQSGAMHP
jgi:hypothetical protein